MFLTFILFTFIRWQNKRNFQRACQMGGHFRLKSKSKWNVCYDLSSRQHKTQRYSLSNCKSVTILKRALLKFCTTKRSHYHNVRTYAWNYLQYTALQTAITVIEVYSSLSKELPTAEKGSCEIYIHVSSRINSCVLNTPPMLVRKEWAFLRQTKRMLKITVLHMQLSFSDFPVLHSPCGSTETLRFGT